MEDEKAAADSLWASLSDAQKSTLAAESFPLWARNVVVLPDSKSGKLELENRPWYWELYKLIHRPWKVAVIRKCTQVGMSTWAVLLASWGASYQWLKGFIYYLPHDSDMADFVKQKVNKVFRATPFLRRTVIQSQDALGVKSFMKSLGYFRGIFTPGNRKTITADVVFLDEKDDMDPEHVKEVDDRLRASDIGLTIKLGVPSVEGYGIDADFQDSTQNYWTLYCEECDREWNVEDTWPSCVDRVNGWLQCSKCKAPTDIRAGYWKPRYPESEIPGYTFNGTMNPNVDLLKEVAAYDNSLYRHIWIRGFLGKPASAGSSKRMTAEQILAQCCSEEHGGGYPQALSSDTDTFMGVDTGASLDTRRMYIGEIKEGVRRILWLGPYKDKDHIIEMMKAFHVVMAVIDAGGEPTLAKELCDEFPRKVFRCSFQSRILSPEYNEKKGTVRVDRVAILDASRSALYSDTVIPSADDEDVKIFASENGAIVREDVKTPEGSTVVKYKSHGPDHGGFAWTYLLMAMTREVKDSTAKAVGSSDKNAMLQTILRRRGLS